MHCLIGLGCSCEGSMKASATSSRSMSHFMATGDIFPVSHCWSLCDASWGLYKYSVVAVDALRWLASGKQAVSFQIANAFCHSDGVLRMSYICFVVHNVAEC